MKEYSFIIVSIVKHSYLHLKLALYNIKINGKIHDNN